MNTKFISILYLFCTLSLPFFGHTQGLKFNNADLPINERTSYTVFESRTPEFRKAFDIEFDMALYPVEEIGYIIRIKSETDQKIYNLFYDGRGDDFFQLNEEGKCNLITARINRRELLDAHWFRMKITFDLERDSIGMSINGKEFSTSRSGLPDACRPGIVFGKSDYIIDVPSFAIRNLSVGNQKRYRFPLNQSEGDVVYDTRGHATGRVSNPEWLINDAFRWKYRTTFSSLTVAGANYNAHTKEVYYFNRDTLFVYDIRTNQTRIERFAKPCPVNPILGTNFLDTLRQRLYVYEVYDDEKPAEQASVAAYDLESGEWSTECCDILPSMLHHHGAWFDAEQEQYTLYGGFGSMRYSNEFFVYDVPGKQWRQMEGIGGVARFPRYFTSVGYLKKNNSVYLFGGMGNESGEQSVGRSYFYDLHRLDLNTHTLEKLWDAPWNDRNSVPVRDMVLLDEDYFYTLCYPESVSDSHLRLYRFSIKDGSYQILGDSIPIHSDKITTNANLYYDAQQNELIATVQEFKDDIISRMKVYTLAFPPITAQELATYSKPQGGGFTTTLLFTVAAACLLAAGVCFVRRRTARRAANSSAARQREEGAAALLPNSVYLFGDFAVRDRRNADITYMLTGKLKQAFCLILQYSAGGGISSQLLSDLLWPDKPEDRVKNSRGVTINHLRKMLKELDGIELVYNKGCFKIVRQAPFYCDYTRCMELIEAGDELADRHELTQILARGKFLKLSDQPLFDSFKEEVERTLEPVLQRELERSFTEEDYATVLTLTDAVFHIDPLNDNALAYQIRALNRMKRSEAARMHYQLFAAEYKKTFGVDYPTPFRNF